MFWRVLNILLDFLNFFLFFPLCCSCLFIGTMKSNASSGQSIWASASVLLVNIQGWFLLRLAGLISLLSKGLSTVLQHHSSKASIIWHSAFYMVQLLHPYMTTGKTIAMTIWTSVGKLMVLLFNTLSRCVIAFLPRSKCLLISWLQSPSGVILEPKKRKSVTASTFSPWIWMKC